MILHHLKPRNYAIYAALCVAGAAGFMIGRISKPDSAIANETPGLSTTHPTRATQTASPDSKREDTTHESRKSSRASLQTPTARLAHIKSIMRGVDVLERNRAIISFIDQLTPEDFPEAMEHFRVLRIAYANGVEYSMLLSAWAKNDPLAAISYAHTKTHGDYETDIILKTWASTDPLSAIRWAEANHTGEAADQFIPSIIRGIAGSNLELATSLLTSISNSDEQRKALYAVTPHVLAQGNEAAREWTDRLSNPVLRDTAIGNMADQMAKSDLTGTISWLIANPGKASQNSMEHIYREWIRKDRNAAMASFEILPSGEHRSKALSGILLDTAFDDPTTGLSIMNLHSSDITDVVIKDFVISSFEKNPTIGVDQISRISDANYRDDLYRHILVKWLEKEPVAAGAWINSNRLPNTVLDYIHQVTAQK